MKTRPALDIRVVSRQPAASVVTNHDADACADHEQALRSLMNGSPRLIGQGRQLEATFGPAVQRAAIPGAELMPLREGSEVSRLLPADTEGESRPSAAVEVQSNGDVPSLQSQQRSPGKHSVAGRGVAQRQITLKDNPERASGSSRALKAEVDATLDGNDLADLKRTLSQLETSIANRKFEQQRYEKYTDSWWSHEARIKEEEGHRDRVLVARNNHPDYKPRNRKKAVTDDGEWTTVGKKTVVEKVVK